MQSRLGKLLTAVAMMGLLFFSGLLNVSAQSNSGPAATAQTGYAVKKPIIGGACVTCPWGAMSEVVKEVMQPYGWDVQICYYCSGGPREARMVAGAMMATPPELSRPDDMPTPVGPIDFGATGAAVLKAAYLGENDFVRDPEGPRKQLRAVAFIRSCRDRAEADAGQDVCRSGGPEAVDAGRAGILRIKPREDRVIWRHLCDPLFAR